MSWQSILLIIIGIYLLYIQLLITFYLFTDNETFLQCAFYSCIIVWLSYLIIYIGHLILYMKKRYYKKHYSNNNIICYNWKDYKLYQIPREKYSKEILNKYNFYSNDGCCGGRMKAQNNVFNIRNEFQRKCIKYITQDFMYCPKKMLKKVAIYDFINNE